MFDDLGITIILPNTVPSILDELQHYLRSDLDTPGEGPLKWWRSKQQLYPRLSLMALNYLSIPGMIQSLC
jgi:hypothetical protein